jgi:hypothetical protein
MSDNPKPKWLEWVALTTTILAVCTAIGSLKASSFSTKVQLSSTKENNAWAYFQSKSIKQHTCELERNQLEIMIADNHSPKATKIIEEKLKLINEDIARYDNEKAAIQKDAKALTTEQVVFKEKNGNLSMAVMLLQIAIMMSSIGALIKRRQLWILGLCFGGVGLVYFLNGFYLWF